MKKSYELPQKQYAFLQSVKSQLGWVTHSIVSQALCSEGPIFRSLLRFEGEEKIIQDLANQHNVSVIFE